eukprot:12408240-Karenia_brevis.AAC.1
MHCGTWLTVDGHDAVSKTSRGSMAGSALADLCFSIALKCFEHLRVELASCGVSCLVDTANVRRHWPSMSAVVRPEYNFQEFSFVDDSVIP